MALPGAMSGRQFLKAFVTGRNFLPISNPQLNGMELLYMCIALWTHITTFSLKPRPLNSQRSCSISTVHTPHISTGNVKDQGILSREEIK